jgi:hypothetical protein
MKPEKNARNHIAKLDSLNASGLTTVFHALLGGSGKIGMDGITSILK